MYGQYDSSDDEEEGSSEDESEDEANEKDDENDDETDDGGERSRLESDRPRQRRRLNDDEVSFCT